MKCVTFDEVRNSFYTVWSDGNEMLFYEIAWKVLTDAGLTCYETIRQRAEILVYPYVLSMLNGEFSERMFQEKYSYEHPQYDPSEESEEDGLTGAALGWLYCDALKEYGNYYEELFECDAQKILESLVFEYRYKVADPLFKVLDCGYLLFVLWYHAVVSPVDTMGNEILFDNAKDFYDYCQAEASRVTERDFSDYFDNTMDEDSVMHWMDCHSCAMDD